MRSNAILNLEDNDKYCCLWSILASLHPCKNDHSSRIKFCKHCSNELNVEVFDFTNGFKCSDVHKFEKLFTFSNNILELKLYQDQNNWKHKLIPIEISKNVSDRVVDFLKYKHHYALKKTKGFLRKS